MEIIIKKIWHRNAFRIAILFRYDIHIINKIKSFGATYSKTLKCWYVDYNTESYKILKTNFENISIEKPNEETILSPQQLTDTNRDLSAIAQSKIQLDSTLKSNPEHTLETIPLEQKLRVRLLTNIGKYWVFKMQYHQSISKQLLAIKGVYWNGNYKCYMALRHPEVKIQIGKIFETHSLFGEDYLSKEKTHKGEKIILKPHPEDLSWMEVHPPKLIAVHEKL
ncbi:hypothetical protein [Flavobacterium flavipallidum]|uniref:Transposase n=1 Tax=Flavobacterium flavipallidum TaxID=3139140 RepID=A0ABU9HQV4_9FLAO